MSCVYESEAQRMNGLEERERLILQQKQLDCLKIERFGYR